VEGKDYADDYQESEFSAFGYFFGSFANGMRMDVEKLVRGLGWVWQIKPMIKVPSATQD
jgi:hypothetical protein